MRNLIAELFMAMVAIAVMTLGVVAVKASIADGFQEIRAAVEERSLRRLLMSKLKGASPRDIRKVAMEALLWDCTLRLGLAGDPKHVARRPEAGPNRTVPQKLGRAAGTLFRHATGHDRSGKSWS